MGMQKSFSSSNSSVLLKDKTGTGMRFPADLIGCSELKQLDFVCFNRVLVLLMNQSQILTMEVNMCLHQPPPTVKTAAWVKVQIFQKILKYK